MQLYICHCEEQIDAAILCDCITAFGMTSLGVKQFMIFTFIFQ
jgi:hypothetical protein